MSEVVDSRIGHPRWPDGGPGRVLAVLDRPVLAELIALTLNHGMCTVRTVLTADEVASVALEWHPHLLVLDMAIDSAAIMQHVRSRAATESPLLVLGLVDRVALASKLAAFDAGVDDILSIPFAPEEFLAPVIALMRRAGSVAISLVPVITVGVLKIDVLNRTVRLSDSELELTPLELGLLYLLAANPGRVLTRQEILGTLWGVEHPMQTKLVEQHIRQLRARLQSLGCQPTFIVTVPGRGYRFLPAGQGG